MKGKCPALGGHPCLLVPCPAQRRGARKKKRRWSGQERWCGQIRACEKSGVALDPRESRYPTESFSSFSFFDECGIFDLFSPLHLLLSPSSLYCARVFVAESPPTELLLPARERQQSGSPRAPPHPIPSPCCIDQKFPWNFPLRRCEPAEICDDNIALRGEQLGHIEADGQFRVTRSALAANQHLQYNGP
ncbi:hypothetical protein HC256_007154 [Beauveria bassiana]|nr:hypothetical protein HC256_007154 [Beauveria bassiana]